MKTFAKVDGMTLIIKLPLQRPAPSRSSGKTLIVASTHGTFATDARFGGKQIVINVNAFIYPSPKRQSTQTNKVERLGRGKRSSPYRNRAAGVAPTVTDQD